ncbi:MAG: YwmB family TATA-box binding protein [Clostridia bacterium]|nr:YwmB family TATA-box binding protein [Clostridia bacterium]
MFFYRLKNVICVALAVLFCLFFAVGVKAVNITRLADIEGRRIYFLDSASSQGLRKESLTVSDLTRVKGECVFTEISAYEGGRYLSNEEIAVEIATRYGAEILIKEEVDGIISYYAYTPRWQDGLYISGKKINLHIAIREENLAVGTPIIFDGF